MALPSATTLPVLDAPDRVASAPFATMLVPGSCCIACGSAGVLERRHHDCKRAVTCNADLCRKYARRNFNYKKTDDNTHMHAAQGLRNTTATHGKLGVGNQDRLPANYTAPDALTSAAASFWPPAQNARSIRRRARLLVQLCRRQVVVHDRGLEPRVRHSAQEATPRVLEGRRPLRRLRIATHVAPDALLLHNSTADNLCVQCSRVQQTELGRLPRANLQGPV
jgi:hypothetical protein